MITSIWDRYSQVKFRLVCLILLKLSEPSRPFPLQTKEINYNNNNAVYFVSAVRKV